MTLATQELDFAEAAQITLDIRDSAEGLLELVVQAYQGRVWIALGYESWDGWKQGELANIELPREAIPALKAEGLSGRAIAAVTGTSEPTVRRAASNDAPARVSGVDGKTYPAKRVIECPTCRKPFDHRVWHCNGCDRHWKPGQDCENCPSDRDLLIEAFPAAAQLPEASVPEALAALAALDAMDEPERDRRSEIFGRWIDARVASAEPTPSEIFAREASTLIDRAAKLGAEVAVVFRQLDFKGIDVWATEYDWAGIAEGLRSTADFIDAQPRIRSVK